MFLAKLNEQEKEMFLSLSMHAAKSNGEFNKDEEELIKHYCYEMNILYFNTGNVVSMDEIISYFKASNEKVKRIIALELIGLLHIDGVYDDVEKSFAMDFFMEIGLNQAKINEITETVKEYLEVSRKMQYVLVD